MSCDICPYCDGTGERDFLSGARCYHCNGTGYIEENDAEDVDDEEWDRQWNEEAKRELG